MYAVRSHTIVLPFISRLDKFSYMLDHVPSEAPWKRKGETMSLAELCLKHQILILIWNWSHQSSNGKKNTHNISTWHTNMRNSKNRVGKNVESHGKKLDEGDLQMKLRVSYNPQQIPQFAHLHFVGFHLYVVFYFAEEPLVEVISLRRLHVLQHRGCLWKQKSMDWF